MTSFLVLAALVVVTVATTSHLLRLKDIDANDNAK